MTRARNAAKGLVTPPHFHRWMEAALLLCVSLVQGAVSMLKMIFKRKARDWHTDDADEALPQATSSISKTGTTPSTVILGLVPRIPVVSSRGTTPYSPEAINQDARHKAEHDAGGVAHAGPAFILRDDGFAIPQDEASALIVRSIAATPTTLILRDLRTAQIVSKDEFSAQSAP